MSRRPRDTATGPSSSAQAATRRRSDMPGGDAFASVIRTASGLMSVATTARPVRRASTAVVPQPANGSRTRSPGSEHAAITAAGICGMNFAGQGCRLCVRSRAPSCSKDQSIDSSAAGASKCRVASIWRTRCNIEPASDAELRCATRCLASGEGRRAIHPSGHAPKWKRPPLARSQPLWTECRMAAGRGCGRSTCTAR